MQGIKRKLDDIGRHGGDIYCPSVYGGSIITVVPTDNGGLGEADVMLRVDAIDGQKQKKGVLVEALFLCWSNDCGSQWAMRSPYYDESFPVAIYPAIAEVRLFLSSLHPDVKFAVQSNTVANILVNHFDRDPITPVLAVVSGSGLCAINWVARHGEAILLRMWNGGDEKSVTHPIEWVNTYVTLLDVGIYAAMKELKAEDDTE